MVVVQATSERYGQVRQDYHFQVVVMIPETSTLVAETVQIQHVLLHMVSHIHTLDTCNATGNISGTACYEVFTSSPLPNCIEVFNRGGTWYVGNTNTPYTDAYAIQEYEKLIAQSNLEYSKLQAAMQQFKR